MSDIGQLRTAAHEARTAFAAATSAANYARKSQVHYEFAERQWRLSHSGETREPVPIIEGNSRWDIPMKPPPSDEEVKRLERAAAKSERKLDKARAALTDFVALSPPRREPSPTGWSAVRSFKFEGVAYDAGDPFDPAIAQPLKLSQMIGSRLIAATSPAGVDRAS